MKIGLIISLMLFAACGGKDMMERRIELEKIIGKEIIFPKNLKNVNQVENEMFVENDFSIIHYVDSAGCTSCKMQLPRWTKIIEEINTRVNKKTSLLLVVSTEDEQNISHIVKYNCFGYKVLMDCECTFANSNQLSSDLAFHTFLVDKDHKVLAVGDPVLNPKVKDLYLKIINGGEQLTKSPENTLVCIDNPNLSLGRFDGREEQKGEVILTNVGDEPLTITDAIPTCDCTSISFPKHPIAPGEQALLSVTYKAEHPGKFEETVTVYGNIKGNTVKFKVSGEAE